jgi:MtaA/CmuA family methyltransferase
VARCFIESVEKYGYDGILVDMDTATLAGALGVLLALPADEPAVCAGARLRSLEEVRNLPPVDISSYTRVEVWLEAVRLLKRYFGDEVYLRGNCDQCPFALASLVRGGAEWMIDLMEPEHHEDARLLLDYCCEATIQFVHLMASTGAHMVSNGDSAAGPSVVSPRLYDAFAQPWEKRVVQAAHQLGLPYALHICGKTEPILQGMLSTGADALELDYKTSACTARDAMAGKAVFIGNLDPSGVLALGSVRDVEEKTRELLRVFEKGTGLILNAGCAIPPGTPSDNIRAMIRVGRQGLS